jgi:hypothetical protein
MMMRGVLESNKDFKKNKQIKNKTTINKQTNKQTNINKHLLKKRKALQRNANESTAQC